MTSTGTDQKAYQMTMSKGDSRYEVNPKRMLFAEKGTELKIVPLLEGIRTLSGEKIQWYLDTVRRTHRRRRCEWRGADAAGDLRTAAARPHIAFARACR
jgi:hypothetical protein